MMTYQALIQIGFALCSLANALVFIPQLVKIIKKHSTKGVSLLTFLGFNVIQLFTLLHALQIDDTVLALGSILSLLTCGAISCTALYYKSQRL